MSDCRCGLKPEFCHVENAKRWCGRSLEDQLGGGEPGIAIRVSLEGAKSFVSDSSGWGAIGLQEITEALLDALTRAGHLPPYKPDAGSKKLGEGQA